MTCRSPEATIARSCLQLTSEAFTAAKAEELAYKKRIEMMSDLIGTSLKFFSRWESRTTEPKLM